MKFTGRDVHFYDLKSPPQHRRVQRFTDAVKADHSRVRKTLEQILSSKFQNSRLILEQKGIPKFKFLTPSLSLECLNIGYTGSRFVMICNAASISFCFL